MRRRESRRSMAYKKSKTGTSSSTTFQVSLLCCRKTGRVLFLETGKDFADALLSFLLLPVGTVLHMLSKGQVKLKPLGGISSVFESVKSLQERSFLNVDKQTLVEPRPAAVGTCVSTGLLQIANTPSPSREIDLPTVYYRCNRASCTLLSTKCGTRCEPCHTQYGSEYTYRQKMSLLPKDVEELEAEVWERLEGPAESEASCSSGEGFVKENITYMVTDSLDIMPSTMIQSIKVLTKLRVATLADLDSLEITVDVTQVLQLLHAALTSSTCLNDVFGRK